MRKIILSILFSLLLFSAFSQVILAPMHWKNGKDLFDTLSVSGGLQHQLLGAKSDNGRLEYLEPLVQGAFVVSDSELNATTLVPAIYDLRNGEKWVSDNAGNFSKDTTGAGYFTDYGVRRFLYNPTTQKTFYVKPDSSYSQIGSGNVFNVHADTTIQNTYVTNDNSYYYSLSDSSWLDDRDFYNDGTITSPYRVRRYDNAYIDSLFASITPGGGGGGGGTTVNNYYTSKLPYNGDSTYYLGGDTIPHKLPAYAGLDTTSLSFRINQKLNITDTAGKWLPIGTKLGSTLKLTTNGQSGPSQYNDTTGELNIPNYFFATNSGDSIDYSLSAMTTIYNEKGPGEYFPRGFGVTVNPDNFNFPFKQLKSLDVSGWSAGDYVSFQNAITANSTAYTFMRAFIRLKQAVPVIQSLSFQFYLNGSAVSKIISMVNYGLDKSMINKYQNISIPMSAFGFTDNNFDEIRLIFGGGSSADGLYLDLFQFQNATTTENKYVTDVFRIPGTTTVQKVLGGQNSFAFNDSVGAAVDTTSLSKRIDDKLNSRDTANKWMPRATPIVNAFNGRAGNVLPQSADYSAYYEPIIVGGTTGQFWRGDKTWQTIPIIDTQFLRRDINTNTAAIATKLNSNFGTRGSVFFRGVTGISESNSNLFYDSANRRIGINTNIPANNLNIISTTRGGGITVGGSDAPAYFLADGAGTLRGSMGLVNTAQDYFTNSIPKDITIRAQPGGRLLLGTVYTENGTSTLPAIVIDSTNNVSLVRLKNNASGDSVLTTDATGKVILKLPTGGGSPQWTTSGSDIFYNGGQVQITSIGTSNSQLKVNDLELQSYAVNNAWIGDNTYFNGSNFVRRAAGYSSFFYFQGSEGQFRFGSNAGAGTVVSDGVGSFGKVVFKVNLDGTVVMGGSMSNAPSNYTGGTMKITNDGTFFKQYTTTSRDAITAKTEGLTIYNTTTHQNETWNGTTWAH